MKPLVIVCLLLFGLASAAGAVDFARSEAVIETQDAKRYRVDIEIAETDEQRAQGLMFREELAADAGMLFLYPSPRVIQMWMRNTLIPLDMLFLDDQGRVLVTADNAVPGSEVVISSFVPAMAVLELPGDAIERLGLKVGDRVLHPRLKGDP
ncbi:MAG: hypothetical protein Kilf2KO_00620 [Rhodospirillales bacterium]